MSPWLSLAEQPKQSQRLRDYISYSETVALSIKSITGFFDNARPEEQVKEKQAGRKEGEKMAGETTVTVQPAVVMKLTSGRQEADS